MDLTEQLEHLDTVFLSRVETQFPNTLTEVEKSTTHAYLVLAHAVLEEHLENVFTAHFRRLVSWLKADLVPVEVVRLAFSMREWAPTNVISTYKKLSILNVMAIAPVDLEFKKRVSQSHGLSPDYVEKLAKLVGLEWESFEDHLDTELAALKTLSSKRGEAGHLSPFTSQATKLTWQDYPENVREWVHAGRDAILEIELYLKQLIDGQQPISLVGDWDGN